VEIKVHLLTDTIAGIVISHVLATSLKDAGLMQPLCLALQAYLVLALEPTATKADTVPLKLHFTREHMTWQI
jgi:hypothetical protein